MEGPEAAALSHGELEDQLDARGRELLRRMYQDHLSLRTATERRLEAVVDSDSVAHGALETGHRRRLVTIFGDVDVVRVAYRHRGHPNLYPADGELNLPVCRHSHGLRRLAATEATRGSFDEAADAVERATGQRVAKRQVEALTATAAVDVDDFYATRAQRADAPDDDVLVLSADGKGIVMRPDALREHTAKAAAAATNKLECRLSKGKKRNRKRLAEVGAVYDLTPVTRTPSDVLASKNGPSPPPAPKARAKWVTASVVEDAATVIATVFDEAERRDPGHTRRWVALVDGNNHQIDRINTEAKARGADVTIVIDLIHVLVLVGRRVVLFRRRRPRRPRLGCRQGHRRARRKRPGGRRRHPATSHRRTAPHPQADQSRRMCQVPDQPGRSPRLPDRTGQGLTRRGQRVAP
ncbi:MAG: ISKra4 family transposase [Actinomycetota bacterium]|nr:ISKra4 family transposase [Actinomycetota bacterium]